MQIITKSSSTIDMNTEYDNKSVNSFTNTKFLVIIIDNILSWKSHIDQIIAKLNVACYEIMVVKPFMSQDNLQMVYYSYFQSLMISGIILWRNSSYSFNIFKLQKRKIGIIMDARSRDSCREYLRN